MFLGIVWIYLLLNVLIKIFAKMKNINIFLIFCSFLRNASPLYFTLWVFSMYAFFASARRVQWSPRIGIMPTCSYRPDSCRSLIPSRLTGVPFPWDITDCHAFTRYYFQRVQRPNFYLIMRFQSRMYRENP